MKGTNASFFLLLIPVLFVGCSNDDYICCAGPVATDIMVSVQSEENYDLLAPTTPNSFHKEEIRLFYEIDGEPVDQGQEEMFYIFRQGQDYVMAIALNRKGGKHPITYIQWDEKDMDTIKAYFQQTGYQVQKVWFNNELKWESTTQYEEPFFEIVK